MIQEQKRPLTSEERSKLHTLFSLKNMSLVEHIKTGGLLWVGIMFGSLVTGIACLAYWLQKHRTDEDTGLLLFLANILVGVCTCLMVLWRAHMRRAWENKQTQQRLDQTHNIITIQCRPTMALITPLSENLDDFGWYFNGGDGQILFLSMSDVADAISFQQMSIENAKLFLDDFPNTDFEVDYIPTLSLVTGVRLMGQSVVAIDIGKYLLEIHPQAAECHTKEGDACIPAQPARCVVFTGSFETLFDSLQQHRIKMERFAVMEEEPPRTFHPFFVILTPLLFVVMIGMPIAIKEWTTTKVILMASMELSLFSMWLAYAGWRFAWRGLALAIMVVMVSFLYDDWSTLKQDSRYGIKIILRMIVSAYLSFACMLYTFMGKHILPLPGVFGAMAEFHRNHPESDCDEGDEPSIEK